jgi:hypothetical protein
MSNSSRKIGVQNVFLGILAIISALLIEGCGDFLGEKAAGMQSQSIISDLSTIKKTAEPNIPVPEVYKAPPKIVEQVVGGKPDWKLFYFCKYHTSEELKVIVNAQFASLTFDEKGKSTKVPDYTVSSNPATNQLIVRCPAKADIDAALQVLQEIDVPPIQVKINCLISEIYADKTLDRETTIKIRNLLGEDISLIPGSRPFGSDVTNLVQEGDVLPAFPGASLRELGRAKMGLKIGYLSRNFTALVDLLESRGYLKILMNPTLETVNGKQATVTSSQHVPLEKITTYVPTQSQYTLESRTEYVDVVDSLKITPHVFADGYIGLETDIVLGSKLTPEGVKQLPIITKKEIENKENRIRPGESLVIGGIRKTEKRDVVRGVPFLKDIPLVGFLFSGRDFEERAVETIFVLTPTISTGGVPREEINEQIRQKHELYIPREPNETTTEPIGLKPCPTQPNPIQKNEKIDATTNLSRSEQKQMSQEHVQSSGEPKIEKAEAQKSTIKADKKVKAEQTKAELENAQKNVKRQTEQSVRNSARDKLIEPEQETRISNSQQADNASFDYPLKTNKITRSPVKNQ